MDDSIAYSQRGRNAVRVRDAVIEEIFIDNNGIGFVKISYGVTGDFQMIQMELLVLVVGRDTVIQDRSGQRVPLNRLRTGMIINAEFSSAMTASIPPQARAFRIIITGKNTASETTVGRVFEVDCENNFLYTADLNDMFNQIRFVITNTTKITNRRGNRIRLCNIIPGQIVKVEHSIFSTFSLPPQTTAFSVQVL